MYKKRITVPVILIVAILLIIYATSCDLNRLIFWKYNNKMPTAKFKESFSVLPNAEWVFTADPQYPEGTPSIGTKLSFRSNKYFCAPTIAYTIMIEDGSDFAIIAINHQNENQNYNYISNKSNNSLVNKTNNALKLLVERKLILNQYRLAKSIGKLLQDDMDVINRNTTALLDINPNFQQEDSIALDKTIKLPDPKNQFNSIHNIISLPTIVTNTFSNALGGNLILNCKIEPRRFETWSRSRTDWWGFPTTSKLVLSFFNYNIKMSKNNKIIANFTYTNTSPISSDFLIPCIQIADNSKAILHIHHSTDKKQINFQIYDLTK